MDIYVYVGDTPIQGEFEKVQVLIPLLNAGFVCEDSEEIGIELPNGKRRLNIYVYDGWNVDGFSSQVLADLQLFVNICHNGDGEVYLINNGVLSIITQLFL